MERLTEKQNGEYILPYDGENLLTISTSRNTVMIGDFKYVTTPNITFLSGKFINKLGELEDVFEKYGIETTKELDGVLKPLIDNGELENWKSAIFWKTQTERLKQELAGLKQKVIAPKFKIGQKVFIILDDTVKETNVDSITIFAGNELSYYCKYVDNKRMYLELAEDEIFTTREEAEAKLKELGENK